jgi:hypothetical protein
MVIGVISYARIPKVLSCTVLGHYGISISPKAERDGQRICQDYYFNVMTISSDFLYRVQTDVNLPEVSKLTTKSFCFLRSFIISE